MEDKQTREQGQGHVIDLFPHLHLIFLYFIQQTVHAVRPPLLLTQRRKSLLTRLCQSPVSSAIWLWDQYCALINTSAGVQSGVLSSTGVGYADMKPFGKSTWHGTWDVTQWRNSSPVRTAPTSQTDEKILEITWHWYIKVSHKSENKSTNLLADI